MRTGATIAGLIRRFLWIFHYQPPVNGERGMTMMILLILENFFLPSKIIMGKHYIRMSYSSLFIPSLCYNFSFHSELRGFLIKKRELDWNGTTPEERMKRRGSKEAGNREWGEYGITERRTSRKLPWNNGNSRKVERCWFASIEMRDALFTGREIDRATCLLLRNSYNFSNHWNSNNKKFKKHHDLRFKR